MSEYPKVIHYCWFGRNPLPESVQKCIASWRKYLPDYEIIEWKEDNFDVNSIPYTQQAYEAKKYAFVSDYARFKILYEHGGLYFDTDVEVIKPMADIVAKGPFMGIEIPATDKKPPLVNPGLGLGANRGNPIYKKVLEYYNTLAFLNKDGTPNPVTVVTHTTKILVENGLQNTNDIQKVQDIWIYPVDYFNPLNDLTGKLEVTDNTRSIHWYTKTWEKKRNPFVSWLSRRIHRYFGVNSMRWLRKLIGRK